MCGHVEVRADQCDILFLEASCIADIIEFRDGEARVLATGSDDCEQFNGNKDVSGGGQHSFL